MAVNIRLGKGSDKKLLIEWLKQPGVLRWYPMSSDIEVEDAARLWVSYAKYEALLTAEIDGEPCGMANLYLQSFQKMKHHALLAIIVSEEHRNKGVGTKLLEELIKAAKERFHMEFLHLEVYEGNPAQRLYERMGFKKYGFQKHFIKDNGEYIGKTFMQKKL